MTFTKHCPVPLRLLLLEKTADFFFRSFDRTLHKERLAAAAAVQGSVHFFCELTYEQHACPEFENVDHISREDGCKVYFTDGSWVICRFSGTEPLLRMAAEAETDEKAQSYIQTWKAFLSL